MAHEHTPYHLKPMLLSTFRARQEPARLKSIIRVLGSKRIKSGIEKWHERIATGKVAFSSLNESNYVPHLWRTSMKLKNTSSRTKYKSNQGWRSRGGMRRMSSPGRVWNRPHPVPKPVGSQANDNILVNGYLGVHHETLEYGSMHSMWRGGKPSPIPLGIINPRCTPKRWQLPLQKLVSRTLIVTPQRTPELLYC